MYIVIGSIDLLQLIFSFFVVTEIANHVIDIIVGALLTLYAFKRGLLTAKKGLVIGATFIAEQIPFVNALPFWTYDLYNLYGGTVSEPVPEIDMSKLPLNANGVRRPSEQSTPLNQSGIRPPRKV